MTLKSIILIPDPHIPFTFVAVYFFGIKLFFFLTGELADGLTDAHFFLRTLPSKPSKYADIAITVINMLPDNDHSLLMKMNVEKQVRSSDLHRKFIHVSAMSAKTFSRMSVLKCLLRLLLGA